MKGYLMAFVAVAALALPAVVRAEQGEARSCAGIEASTEEGLITSDEEKALTRPKGAPAVDEETMRQYFDTAPYKRPGGQGGPAAISG